MKISARNVLAGTVKHIEDCAVNSEVIIELPGGAELVSSLPRPRSPVWESRSAWNCLPSSNRPT